MNTNHRNLCDSDRWAEYIRDEVLPWVLGDRPLGGSLLELGPGPGRTTTLLRTRVRRLTAVESDGTAVRTLKRRFRATNVTVVQGSGDDLPFRRGRFSSAVALTMLHHVPTTSAQDALFAEVCRVLRPGGWFLGEDSTDDPGFRGFHRGDVCNPVDPATLAPRLRASGFDEAEVELGDHIVRFAARRHPK